MKCSLATLLLSVSFASYSQIITTIAGNRIYGFSGDRGQATSAELPFAAGIAIEAFSNRKENFKNTITVF